MAGELPEIPVLVGPTAVGKTAVAVELATRVPLTVISADSRQIYKSLDIGTAKPTFAEQELAPHLGLDVCYPGQNYSAGSYVADARDWIDATLRKKRIPLVCGGTGFYINALVSGIFNEPEMDPARRERLRAALTREVDDPVEWARALDPDIGAEDRQRALRALEVALLTGRRLSEWHSARPRQPAVRGIVYRMTMERSVLHERIEARVDRMMESGLVEETAALLERYSTSDAGLDAVGYREAAAFLSGQLSGTQMRDQIVIATRQYAKRQETWFRNQLPLATVIDSTDLDARGVADVILDDWSRRTWI